MIAPALPPAPERLPVLAEPAALRRLAQAGASLRKNETKLSMVPAREDNWNLP